MNKILLEVINSQERLIGLIILSIEEDILKNIDIITTINDFASLNVHKNHFVL